MSKWNDDSTLGKSISTKLQSRRIHSTYRQLTTNPPNSADFSSNDFLSLATNEELKSRYLEALSSDLTRLGSGGSRLLDGNSTLAESIEREIATFHNAPAGLLCNSGFDANVSLFSTLPQPGDVVLFDELIHASVRDGMKISRAGALTSFTHNDTAALGRELERCLIKDEAIARGERNVFVAVEAVYSMDGDVAPLAEIVELLASALPKGNGHLIVDEAHSTGVFGQQGRGLVCELGLEDRVTVRLHTFGKAMACSGAILLCSDTIKDYLINYARPLIYTTFMSQADLIAIRTSYRFLMSGHTRSLTRNLSVLIMALHDRLREAEALLRLLETEQHLFSVPHERSRSAISFVLTSKPKALQAFCMKRGLVVRGILPPTVPAGTERVRICLHAGNTLAEVDRLVDTMRQWVESQLKYRGDGELRARL